MLSAMFPTSPALLDARGWCCTPPTIGKNWTVLAMPSAMFDVLGSVPDLQALDIRVLPGITAMLAAAARAGAPLGDDFCAINLSDNLKSWALIESRLRLAAKADF